MVSPWVKVSVKALKNDKTFEKIYFIFIILLNFFINFHKTKISIEPIVNERSDTL